MEAYKSSQEPSSLYPEVLPSAYSPHRHPSLCVYPRPAARLRSSSAPRAASQASEVASEASSVCKGRKHANEVQVAAHAPIPNVSGLIRDLYDLSRLDDDDLQKPQVNPDYAKHELQIAVKAVKVRQALNQLVRGISWQGKPRDRVRPRCTTLQTAGVQAQEPAATLCAPGFGCAPSGTTDAQLGTPAGAEAKRALQFALAVPGEGGRRLEVALDALLPLMPGRMLGEGRTCWMQLPREEQERTRRAVASFATGCTCRGVCQGDCVSLCDTAIQVLRCANKLEKCEPRVLMRSMELVFLLTRPEAHKPSLAALGCMDLVISAMRHDLASGGDAEADAAVQEFGCGALRNLAQHPANRARLQALGAADAVLSAAARHAERHQILKSLLGVVFV